MSSSMPFKSCLAKANLPGHETGCSLLLAAAQEARITAGTVSMNPNSYEVTEPQVLRVAG